MWVRPSSSAHLALEKVLVLVGELPRRAEAAVGAENGDLAVAAEGAAHLGLCAGDQPVVLGDLVDGTHLSVDVGRLVELLPKLGTEARGLGSRHYSTRGTWLEISAARGAAARALTCSRASLTRSLRTSKWCEWLVLFFSRLMYGMRYDGSDELTRER